MNYLYLLINLLVIGPPLLLSFDKKVHFYSYWKWLVPSMLLTAAGFLFWDEYFTSMGYWGFNPDYLTGIYFGHLPLEEVLFFITVPYACVFSYACLNAYFPMKKTTYPRWVFGICAFTSITISALFLEQPYTAWTLAFLGVCFALLSVLPKQDWVLPFFRSYVVILPLFLLVNGILTGSGIESPIVWYNPNSFSELRILTIPIEDAFYGLLLLLINVGLMETGTKFVNRG